MSGKRFGGSGIPQDPMDDPDRAFRAGVGIGFAAGALSALGMYFGLSLIMKVIAL